MTRSAASAALDRLSRFQLLVVTGKGGVGKTTVAVALAEALAERGRRVLLLEVDPRENAHQMLGVPPSGGDEKEVRPRLRLQNLRPREVLDQVVREQLRLDLIAKRVLRSPVYEHFAEGCPGLKELAVLGQAARRVRGLGARPGPPIDLAILDAPASGHGVSLLAAPLLVAEVIEEGPFGRLAGELAELVGDPSRTGVVAVTTAEEMPVQEVLELLDQLEGRLARQPELVAINCLYPPAPSPASHEDSLERLWRQRRAVNERQRNRLYARWTGAKLELPLLPLDRGPVLVAALRRRWWWQGGGEGG